MPVISISDVNASSVLIIVASVLAALFAVIATVLVAIFITPEKRKASLGKLGLFLHNLCNFKSLLIEKILKVLYVFSTVFCAVFGFVTLFWFTETSKHALVWNGWIGLILLIAGPIVIRLAYEAVMMFVLLVKNVIDIRNRMGGKDEDKEGK